MSADGHLHLIIDAILLHEAVCLDCLAHDVRLPVSDGPGLVERMERTLVLAHEYGRCAVCERETTVYGIRGSRRFPFLRTLPPAPSPPAVSTNGGPSDRINSLTP